MENPKFKWCRQVIEQIRFKPDRDKIWDELVAHIEDRAEDMKCRGYNREEAEIRAVTAMGDPEEVGKQLNTVHKPWLGWLWIVSKVLLILTLIVSMFLAYPAVRRYWDAAEDDANERNTVEYWVGDVPIAGRYTVGRSMEIDGYRFTVDEVTWYREEEFVRLAVCVTVRRSVFQPELDRYSGNIDAFYIVDDRGNREVDWYGDPNLPRRRVSYWDSSKVNRPLTGSCIYVYDAMNWNPNWVEFSFDFEGKTHSIRFPGPGGEGV